MVVAAHLLEYIDARPCLESIDGGNFIIYDGYRALRSGFKTKTYRGAKYNELVFDDATDQERVRLNSEHAKSQLNLGYLIHQQGNRRGAFRGTGFELCSDAYGAIRANEGHYLTSWGQLGAGGDQGKSLSLTSGEDINLATGRNLIASLSERLSLFVQRAAIKLFAASGKVEVQAQSDAMALTAEQDLTITATAGKVHLNAANGVLLNSVDAGAISP